MVYENILNAHFKIPFLVVIEYLLCATLLCLIIKIIVWFNFIMGVEIQTSYFEERLIIGTGDLKLK